MNMESIFSDGDDYFNALIQSIDQSQQTIEFESYIFDRDEIGNKVLNQLVQATRRGVQVKLLLDGAGASSWTQSEAQQWRDQGLDLRFFHPMPWQMRFHYFWESIGFKRFFLGLSKFNRRNHRKLIIIDRSIAFLGSYNITKNHSKIYVKNLAWQDLGIKINDDRVQSLFQQHQTAWNYSWKELPRLMQSKRMFRKFLVQTLRQCQSRIWLATPYWIPPASVQRAMIEAAQRGVDVRLMVPASCDSWGVKWVIEGFYESLLKAKVKIYEYQPSLMHAKTVLMDQSVWMGSVNYDNRGLYYDLETSIELQQDSSRQSIDAWYQQNLMSCKKITLESWMNRSWFNKIIQKVFVFFRPVL
jgi:cardiolipin synthase